MYLQDCERDLQPAQFLLSLQFYNWTISQSCVLYYI